MRRCSRLAMWSSVAALAALAVPVVSPAQVRDPALCEGTRTVRAHVVALDQVIWLNRNGASIPGGMMYALASDVFPDTVTDPSQESWANSCAVADCDPGAVHLGTQQRPRPLVLRANEGDCVEIEFTNLLAPAAEAFGLCANDPTLPCLTNAACGPDGGPCQGSCSQDASKRCTNDGDCGSGNTCEDFFVQPSTRAASVHVQGLNWVGSPADDGGAVGANCYSSAYPGTRPTGPDYCQATPGNTVTYRLFAEHEGPYLLYSRGDDSSNLPSGGGGDGGQLQEGLFGAFHVQPSGYDSSGMEGGGQEKRWESGWYRSQVTEQDLCLAQAAGRYDYTPPSGAYPLGLCVPRNPNELPLVDYQAVYPAGHPRAGLPVLNMLCTAEVIARGATCPQNELVASDLTAVITGPVGADGQPGRFPEMPVDRQPPSLRPVYSYPERLQPYREFTIIYHESYQVNQAFASVYDEFPALGAAQDNFGINYGMGGIGSVVLANRLRVSSVDECVDCKYEEFFLSSWPLGDPAMNVAIPGSTCFVDGEIDEDCQRRTAGKNKALYPDDPSNVYHSYMMDHVKFRILHAGPDLHHLHHQHAHQWLGTPNSPNGDYLDSQSIGPGSAFTLEMVYNGSGNVNQTVGDSIFHCHFYPHFASGMWSLWRVHDVFEAGTILGACPFGGYGCPADRRDSGGRVSYTRAQPDGEIVVGTPIPGLVPMPGLPMAPLPAPVRLVEDGTRYEVRLEPAAGGVSTGEWVSPMRPAAEPWSAFRRRYRNPGYPFFIPGIAGSRPPHPPLDFAWACRDSGEICAPTDDDLRRYDVASTSSAAAGAARSSALAAQEAMGEILGMSDMRELKGTCNLLQGHGPCEPMNGGLPRHVTARSGAGDERGSWTSPPLNNTDFSKLIDEATAFRLPEGGSMVEKIAIATHAERFHDTRLPDGQELGICIDDLQLAPGDVRTTRAPCGEVACSAPGARPCDPANPGRCCDTSQCGNPGDAVCDLDGRINFVLNGLEPQHGAPFADPCIQFNRAGGEAPGGIQRDYLAVDIQLDAIFDKAGWHFPQQRMISLWGDARDFMDRQKPPEPLFMRVNSYDCMNYVLANLVPNVYELDDFQVRTPTDILGQHIHLVKFDVTSSDGAANGWNYEDGTFAPNEVTERIEAINQSGGLIVEKPDGGKERMELEATWIKFFGPGPGTAPGNPQTGQWVGSQATVQRWYNDPLFNNIGVCETDLDVACTLGEAQVMFGAPMPGGGSGCPANGTCIVSAGFCSDDVGARCTEFDTSRCGDRAECNPSHDRTIRTVFTHDHFGPSTHQQAGLYAGVVPEPKDSVWRDNETGEVMGGYNAATQAPFPGRRVTQNGVTVRDSGPTSWQAVIETPFEGQSFREFMVQAQDSTLMYLPFGNGEFYSEAWSAEGRSQFRDGDLGPCDPMGHEPCGFCSYSGACSNDPSRACTVAQPLAGGTCSATATQKCTTDSGCPPQESCVRPGSRAGAECGDPNASCQLRLGYLQPCTPTDRSQCRSPGVESCNFIAGVPSTSWSHNLRSINSPLATGGQGGGGDLTVEAVTFGGATNNFSFNYRNEPLYPRITEISDPKVATTPMPGRAGDLGFVYSSFGTCSNDGDRLCVDDAVCGAGGRCLGRPSPRGTVCTTSLDTYCTADADCPSGGLCQPAGFCSDNYALCAQDNLNLCGATGAACLDSPGSFPYPPLTAGIERNDPFTPIMRAYAGDDVQVRVLIGAHINPHNLTIHGLNWLKEPSFVDSGWRNSETMGISEHFESIVKLDPPFAAPAYAPRATRPWTDYLFKPGAAAIEQASGNWGLIRAYDERQRALFPLPQNPPPPGGFEPVSACPAGRLNDRGEANCRAEGVRCYEVVATTAKKALGGPLVYNPGVCSISPAACIQSSDALLFFNTADPDLDCTRSDDGVSCKFPQCTSGTCSNGGGTCSTIYDCWTPEPMVLRANAGDCIQVTLHNRLEEAEVAKLGGVPSEQFTTQASKVSPQVGLRPQLVTYDLRSSDGTNVGFNSVQTAPPGGTARYVWYAGHIDPDPEAGEGRYVPIEFGGANLLPPDPLNHYGYGLFGGLVIEPPGSTWDPGAGAETSILRADGSGFREFVLFMQDGPLNTPFVNGGVEAVNYRANKPLGVRVTGSPNQLFAYCTEAACNALDQSDVSCVNSANAYCRVKGPACKPCGEAVPGWPDTPIFEACAGEEVRFRLLHPGGTNTNEVFELFGHTFSEAPYMTLPDNCEPPTTHTNLRASQRLGTKNLCASSQFFLADRQQEAARQVAMATGEDMPDPSPPRFTGGVWDASLNEWKGSKMGHGPSNHFDVLVAEAGGANWVPGDYLYRSYSIMHYNNGIWGIFRVKSRDGGQCLEPSPAARGLELSRAEPAGEAGAASVVPDAGRE